MCFVIMIIVITIIIIPPRGGRTAAAPGQTADVSGRTSARSCVYFSRLVDYVLYYVICYTVLYYIIV